jgi:hypothetical protein
MQARPTGVVLLSIALGVLGLATLLAFLVGLARGPSPDASWLLVSLGLIYGITALASATTLWRLSPKAPLAFLSWCASLSVWTLALSFEVAELRSPLMIPSLVVGVLCLITAFRYIRRKCAPAV